MGPSCRWEGVENALNGESKRSGSSAEREGSVQGGTSLLLSREAALDPRLSRGVTSTC